MKIGIVTPSVSRLAGGLLDSVRGLAQRLSVLQNTVDVFAIQDSYSSADLRDWDSVKVRLFNSLGPSPFNYSPHLTAALCEADCEIVLSQGLWRYVSIATSRWHRRRRKPYVVNPHGMLDSWSLRRSGLRKRIAAALYENNHLRNAACIRALCAPEVDAIRRYGLRNPICLVPNGVDESLPEAKSLSPPWSNNPDLRDKKILLSLGRIHPKKNLADLLQAWSNCLLRPGSLLQGWALVIAGWDELDTEAELKNLSTQLGLTRLVHFAGPLYGGAKAAAYGASSAFVLPSLGEGLPMVVLEAWSYGLPALITHQCNLPEGVKGGAAIVTTSDHRGLESGLQQLGSLTKGERMIMGERAKSLVRNNFNWLDVGRQMNDVLLWLVGEGPRPTCVIP